MKYNFDEEICREGTSCEKFDLRDEIFGRDDVIPLWVADMDFAAPPEVTEAIRKRAVLFCSDGEKRTFAEKYCINKIFDLSLHSRSAMVL